MRCKREKRKEEEISGDEIGKMRVEEAALKDELRFYLTQFTKTTKIKDYFKL